LLQLNASIRFLPSPGFDGPATLTYRAWDQTSGTAGDQNADVSINGAHTAFSMNEATLTLQVNAPVAVPQLVADNGLVANSTSSNASITTMALQASEGQSSSAQLTFTVTSPPTAGTLLVGGQQAQVGSQFTQADIDAGRVRYTPTIPTATSDAFTFVVSDAAGASLAPSVFHIKINSAPPVAPKTVPPLTALPANSTPSSIPSGLGSGIGAIALGSSSSGGSDSSGESTATPSDSIDAGGSQSSGSSSGSASTGGGSKQQQSTGGAVVNNVVSRPVAVPLPRAAVQPAIETNSVGAPPTRSAPVASVLSTGVDVQNGRTDGVVLLIPDPSGDGSIGKLANLLGNHDNRGVTAVSATFANDSALWHDLDKLQDKMTSEHKFKVEAGTAAVGSMAVSVVYILWAVRAGSILSSLISSMPAWKLVDPLPILDQMAAGSGGRNRFGEEDDDETLESMVEGTARKAA
jgi:hypothetical protein